MFWKLKKVIENPIDAAMYTIRKKFKSNNVTKDDEIAISFDSQVYYGNPVKSGIAKSILHTGYWEYFTSQKLKNSISKSDHVVDVGAAGGYFTLLAAKRAYKVTCFEPIPIFKTQLDKNIKHNNYTNCTTHELALLNENTSHVLSQPGVKSRIVVDNINSSDNQDCLTIRCVKFDDFHNETKLGKVDLIKIDIEGCELLALRGMISTLKTYKPKLLIELHPSLFEQFGYNLDDLLKFLHDLDYKICPVDVGWKTFNAILQGSCDNNIVIYASG